MKLIPFATEAIMLKTLWVKQKLSW